MCVAKLRQGELQEERPDGEQDRKRQNLLQEEPCLGTEGAHLQQGGGEIATEIATEGERGGAGGEGGGGGEGGDSSLGKVPGLRTGLPSPLRHSSTHTLGVLQQCAGGDFSVDFRESLFSFVSPSCQSESCTIFSQVDLLVNSLNPRGDREGELRDRLISQRERIERRMKKCQVSVLSRSQEDSEHLEASMEAEEEKRRSKAAPADGSALPLGTPLQDIMELALRDQLLELEEKIFVGALGYLKSTKQEKENLELRSTWRNSIESKSYRMLADHLEWGEEGRLEAKEVEGKEGELVKQLAAAILQVEQMISTEDVEKYLKEPLGEGEKERKKRQKKEEDREKKKAKAEEAGEEFEEDDDAGSGSTPLKKWEISLMNCTNLSQLFVHLTTLDNSIVWSKSVMNTKCRLCRRKTDPDRMLLCDGCDRGHHMYCLKPAMKKVPEGDWFCPECKPKERIRSPKKKVRSRFSMCEEEDEDGDDDEDDVQEESSPPAKKSKSRKKLRIVESEDDEEEEEEPKPRKDKKKSQKKKAIVESEDEEVEEEDTPPKRGGRSRKKVEDEEEMDSSPPAKKKGKESAKKGLSNLFGRRQAAKKSDERRRGEVEEDTDHEEEEEEEQEAKSRSSRRSRASKDQENKENSRAKGKRGRGEDNEEDDLDLNVGEMDELLKGELPTLQQTCRLILISNLAFLILSFTASSDEAQGRVAV